MICQQKQQIVQKYHSEIYLRVVFDSSLKALKKCNKLEKLDLQIKCLRRYFAYVGLHNKQLSKL